MRETRVALAELTVGALAWGPESGPLAVLLHGFPDTAHTWRHLGPVLAGHGWHVVAPFLRGYAPTDVPPDGGGHVAALMDDAAGLHQACGGRDDAVLIGHDWGAIAANALAAHPDSPFARVVSLSVPPFRAVRSARSVLVLPRQLRNSWYIAFNQLPWLPERVFEPLVRRLWHDWSPGYDAGEDLRHLASALPDVTRRRAAIDYYRALARSLPPPERYRRWSGAQMRLPAVPLLYLHGADDRCLDPRLVRGVAAHLPAGSRTRLVEGAGHFVQLEQPEVVAAAVLDFLA
jgi:pimeloyl-ACP methyl ester carboxylesterase